MVVKLQYVLRNVCAINSSIHTVHINNHPMISMPFRVYLHTTGHQRLIASRLKVTYNLTYLPRL